MVAPFDPLSRTALESGDFAAILARDAPGQRLMTDEERDMSLRRTLAERLDGDIWLFDYGSLIWNPTICLGPPKGCAAKAFPTENSKNSSTKSSLIKAP